MTSTQADLDELIKTLELLQPKQPIDFSVDEIDLLIDALVFYKDMNTY